LCIGSDRRSKPDRRSVFERLSPCNRFFSSDRVSTPLRRSLPERLSVQVRLSSSLIDASPAVLQDTLRPNRLARISREQPGTGDAKIAPKCLRFMEGPRGRRTKPGKGPRASGQHVGAWWRYSTPFLSTGSVATLSHDMQRKVFNVDKPPARGRATMNFISAPHRSHFRAGFSSVLPVPITKHYARSARTRLQKVRVSHNQTRAARGLSLLLRPPIIPGRILVGNAALCITAKLMADGRDGSTSTDKRYGRHVRTSPDRYWMLRCGRRSGTDSKSGAAVSTRPARRPRPQIRQ
jgi:hypothetical protein